jgi:hypothetical protein
LWIHLALVFPVARRFRGRRRLVLALPYLLSTVGFAAAVNGFFQRPPNLAPLSLVWQYTGAAIVFFYAAMAYAYWEDREPGARPRVRAIFVSLVLATILPLFAFLNNASAGGAFPLQFGLVLFPVFYGSIVYAIVVHDLFNIDRFVRLGFVYSLLSLIVLGTYALALETASRLAPSFAAANPAWINAAFVLALAFGLDPLRRAVQRVVDRAFYRGRLDYRATIHELSEVMTTLLDLREIVGQVTRVVIGAMQLERRHAVFAYPRRRADDGAGR